MRRRIFFIFLATWVSGVVFGQEGDLTITRQERKEHLELNGLARAVFMSTTADLMIKTTDDEYECSKPVVDGDSYKYTIDIDVSTGKTRVFVVTKAGTPLRGKSRQFIFNKNEVCYFEVGQPKTILGKASETINSKAYFLPGNHPTKALIEINSGIKLDISYSEYLHVQHRTALRNGTYIDSLIFEVPRLAALQQYADSLQHAFDRLSASSNSSWTEKQWQELEKLEAKKNKAAEISAGAALITIQGNGTNMLTINEELVRRLTPKDKLTYGILVVETSFDDLLATAKRYLADYPKHVESSYYDAAKIAYDNAIQHNDCPQKVRDTLRMEYDLLAEIRKNSFYAETADKKAAEAERRGVGCEEILKYLGAEVKFIDRLLDSHPEIIGYHDRRREVLTKIESLPCSKVADGTETIQHNRETLSGTVRFKHEYMAVPFSEMKVYATTSKKIKGSQSRFVGFVNADGTFGIVKPDNFEPLYIYLSGEKGDAHYVPKGMTKINITVK